MLTKQISHHLGFGYLKSSSFRANFVSTPPDNLVYAGTDCTLYKEEVLVGRTPIDGDLQRCVPQLLRKRFLTFFHYLLLSKHLEKHRMYATMQRD